MHLVLSLFHGVGLLDMAFEEAGFCVVRGPDLLWGDDVRRFHPPPGRFDGVIGGPPCQAHSPLARIVRHTGHQTAPDLIPEFERCVREADPLWWMMECVAGGPAPEIPGFHAQQSWVLQDHCFGGDSIRRRKFYFGGPWSIREPVCARGGMAAGNGVPLVMGGRAVARAVWDAVADS